MLGQNREGRNWSKLRCKPKSDRPSTRESRASLNATKPLRAESGDANRRRVASVAKGIDGPYPTISAAASTCVQSPVRGRRRRHGIARVSPACTKASTAPAPSFPILRDETSSPSSASSPSPPSRTQSPASVMDSSGCDIYVEQFSVSVVLGTLPRHSPTLHPATAGAAFSALQPPLRASLPHPFHITLLMQTGGASRNNKTRSFLVHNTRQAATAA